MRRRLRRAWRRWLGTLETPAPERPPDSSLPSHQDWLRDLLDDLKVEGAERQFVRADLDVVFDPKHHDLFRLCQPKEPSS